MYSARRCLQAAKLALRRRCSSLGCPGGDNLTWIASWRTRRMARRKRNVSDLPYTASPLSCVAFFVKEQGRGQIERAKRKGGRFAFCVNLP